MRRRKRQNLSGSRPLLRSKKPAADNVKDPLGSSDKGRMQATRDPMVKYLELKDPPPVVATLSNEFLS
jgi:hypothetical protein